MGEKQTWRADPTKTFFAGIAFGMMLPLMVLVFVALMLP